MKTKELKILIKILLITVILGLSIISTVQAAELKGEKILYSGNDYNSFTKVLNTADGGFVVMGEYKSTELEGLTNKGEQDIVIIKYDKDENIVWKTSFGGNKTEAIKDAIITTDGGFVLVGDSNSTDIVSLNNSGDQDAIIVKYDKDGNVEWQNSYGGSDTDWFNSVVETIDGGFITGGLMWSTDITGITNNGRNDGMIVKYDKGGNVVWQKGFGGSEAEYFTKIIKTSLNEYITIGIVRSSDIEGITHKGGIDALIVKYDDNGNVIWQKNYGGSNSDTFSDAILTSDGGFVAVGDTLSKDIEGITNNTGYYDGIIVKYDKDGNVEWQKSSTTTDVFHRIIETSDGGYILYGIFSSAASNGFDAVITKIDKNGKIEWEREYIDKSKTAIEFMDMFIEENSITLVGTKRSTINTTDETLGAFIIKYDMQGNELWRSSLGKVEYEDSLNLVIKIGNEYVAVGSVDNDGVIFRAIDEYNITLDKVENGKVTVESKATVGSNVKIKIESEEGYELKEIKVTDKDKENVKVSEKDYTFVMPESDVKINVTFEKEIIPSEQPKDENDDVTTGEGKEDIKNDDATTEKENNKDTESKDEQKDNNNNEVTEKPRVDTEVPATGDNVVLYIVIAIVAVIGIVTVFITNKKQKNK